MNKDISINMKHAGKREAICDHYCKKQVRNTEFYHWYSFLDTKYLKTMCVKCALRETWGYNYKSSTKYKKWAEQ